MKAATQHTYGSPNVLQIEEIVVPSVGDHDVLVAVRASAVSHGDRRMRSADFPGSTAVLGRLAAGVFRPRNPTGGTVFSGRVAAIGRSVTRYAVGDDVFGAALHGSYAEYLSMAEDGALAHMPHDATYEQAAALPYGAMTALVFMRDLGEVQPNQRVLILGASGGVGRFAVQIAKHLGAEVTGVCSAASFELVRTLGADHLIDYRTDDFTQNGRQYDVIFDTATATTFSDARHSLTSRGRFLTLALGFRVLAEMAVTALLGGRRAIFGVSFGSADQMAHLALLAEQGAISPVIDRSFPLAQIDQAHAYQERQTDHGTVIVTMEASGAEVAAAK